MRTKLCCCIATQQAPKNLNAYTTAQHHNQLHFTGNLAKQQLSNNNATTTAQPQYLIVR
jgi:hypothetical protein